MVWWWEVESVAAASTKVSGWKGHGTWDATTLTQRGGEGIRGWGMWDNTGSNHAVLYRSCKLYRAFSLYLRKNEKLLKDIKRRVKC